MSAKIIGKISFSPETIVPGQSVFVQVNSLDGTNFNVDDDTIVRINGVFGPNQYLQFEEAGKKTIVVSASSGKNIIETQTVEFEVADIKSSDGLLNPSGPRFIALSFHPKLRSLPILNLTRA